MMDLKYLEALTTSLPTNMQDTTLDNLYPALLQCFAVILCGYLAGKWKIVTQDQCTGLNTFVGTFCLPSLIFMSLALLDLSSVNWYFLVSVLIAKAIVFVSVMAITLLIARPFSPGRSGLFAIFCTQSNDFAIGFPIVAAIYQKTHPEYISYIYLLAPVNLVILNPFAFVLMEFHKQKTLLPGENDMTTVKMIKSILQSIATNPVVFMTLFGMLANIVCNHTLPIVVSEILNVFGSAFIGTALFLLGLRMVDKVGRPTGIALLVPGILIAVKLIALPLIIREVVNLVLHSSGSSAQETQEMSTYGFLYGTFPSAPGVFVYATRYALDIDLIASSMVACTIVSAPLMFASAKMVVASNLHPVQYMQTLDLIEFYVSIVASLSSIWLLVSMIVNKKFQSLPYRMTIFLILSQLLGCIGFLTSHFPYQTLHDINFAVVTVGDLSTCLWTAFISAALLMIECRRIALLSKLQPLFIFLAWGLPSIVSLVFIFKGVRQLSPTPLVVDDGYEYGQVQATIYLFTFVISFLGTLVCLVLYQWYQRRRKQYLLLVREANECVTSIQATDGEITARRSSEDEILESQRPSNGTNAATRLDEENKEEQEMLRLIVLLVFLLCCIFIRLSMCIWRVITEDIYGDYVELLFIDTTLNRGQSLIVLAVLGMDMELLIQPIISWTSHLWYGGDTVKLPGLEELQFETKHVCEQFISHHLDQCKSDIALDKRINLWRYEKVFSGSDLVSWLVTHNVAETRNEAAQYGFHLLYGRLIKHVHDVQLFHDSSQILYTFITPN
uniref:DEP domain-containing protein n=1 Tax=Clastoptera arizonana TaxID=38151 RepID=A0A1B6CSN7_9HEMI